MSDLARWRGLGALIRDAVEHGARAVERVHLATAERPFRILEQIPGIAEPARGVHTVHDTFVSGVYAQIRLVNRVVGQVLDISIDALEARSPQGPPGPQSPRAAD